MLGNTLTVAEAITRGHNGKLGSGPPKSAAGHRILTMPKPLVDILAEHLARAGMTAASGDALVFANENGGPVQYSSFRTRAWIPAVKAAGCEGAGFHDLRRLAATSLVLQGVDVKTAQTRLGHSDPRLTLSIYATATTEADIDAANRLTRLFFTERTDSASGAYA
jgi:integrase